MIGPGVNLDMVDGEWSQHDGAVSITGWKWLERRPAEGQVKLHLGGLLRS